jgi:hypothetical protein
MYNDVYADLVAGEFTIIGAAYAELPSEFIENEGEDNEVRDVLGYIDSICDYVTVDYRD